MISGPRMRSFSVSTNLMSTPCNNNVYYPVTSIPDPVHPILTPTLGGTYSTYTTRPATHGQVMEEQDHNYNDSTESEEIGNEVEPNGLREFCD